MQSTVVADHYRQCHSQKWYYHRFAPETTTVDSMADPAYIDRHPPGAPSGDKTRTVRLRFIEAKELLATSLGG
jgi:hypothetical protein